MIEEVEQFNLQLEQLPVRRLSQRILLAEPTYYDVEYIINPHMVGSVGSVDKRVALAQWQSLKAAYIGIGMDVSIIPAAPGFPDMVFIANQSFPAYDVSGARVMVMSRMFAEQRRGEVPLVESFYAERGITVRFLPGAEFFEGTGDALWYPNRALIVGGHGYRTSRAALASLGRELDVPVVGLDLIDPRFYHLDTCLSFLTEHTALYVPDAFSPRSKALLNALVPELVAVPIDEAVEGLACNGHCPDGETYIVHHANTKTIQLVKELGLQVAPVDTGEFLKSGGSVFCMKLMLA